MSDRFKFSNFLTLGDINGFLSIIVNILAVISFVSTLLIFQFKMPAQIVLGQMVPAMSIAAFFSNIVFSYMAIQMAKKTVRKDITALPSGLDTPSSVGLAMFVVGPAFVSMKNSGIDPNTAAAIAWHIGMASVVYIGIIKIALSSAANVFKKYIPLAGILGSLAGLSIGLIGIQPLIETFSIPIVGLVSFGIILFTLVARNRLPGNIPGVFVAVALGTIIYHSFGPSNLLGIKYLPPLTTFYVGYSIPFSGLISGLHGALDYLPIIIPFALIVFVADAANTVATDIIGDHYSEKKTCLADGICTLLGGLCGSISQTTIYIQQIPCRSMDSKIGYTIISALFFLAGAFLGFITFFISLIPTSALAPILVYIAIEVTAYVFICVPIKHYTAVSFAMFPPIMKYIAMQFSDISSIPIAKLQDLTSHIGAVLPHVLVTFGISNGYMIVSMLWGGLLVEVIERRFKFASCYLFILAVLSFFGIIHSGDTSGAIYLPWMASVVERTVAYDFSSAYLVLGIVMFFVALFHSKKKTDEVLTNV
ncbi:MAG: hypothetical protein WCR55_02010 [Lentisphaerota bacterium]